MKRKQLTVGSADANRDLLGFLADRIGISRRQAKALLDSRNVVVDGQRIWMAKHVLRAGQKVEAILPERSRHPGTAALDICYEDDAFVVVDKRSGLLSNNHPESVEAIVRQQLHEPRLTAVHRLDRDTTGCLLLARDPESHALAVEQFRSRDVRKLYHAIVRGHMSLKEQRLTTALDGQHAATRVTLLDAGKEASHVRIAIETGRTHQIRRHLAQIGHPVLGDRQYATRVRVSGKLLKVGRQMLHAAALELSFPAGRRPSVRARAPLPRDFRQCLRSFRLS